MPSGLTWAGTDAVIAHAEQAMSAIHVAYPGKENRAVREPLLHPWRRLCIDMHYRRIELNLASRVDQPARDHQIN